MFRNGKVLNKALAGILTAACVVTSMPMGSFAAEVNAGADEAVVIEETAEAVSEDSVEALEADVEADIVEDEEAVDNIDYNDVTAENEDAVEPDGDVDPVLQNAKTIKLGTTENGTATLENKAYYKFIPEKTGRYELTGKSDADMTVRVFDGDKYVERRDGCYYWHRQYTTVLDDTGAQGNKVDLIGGKTCYIVVENASANSEISFDFTINLKFEVTKSLKSEPTEVAFDKVYEGHLCPDFNNSENYTFNANNNYYKFTLKEPGTFTFHIEDDSTKPSERTNFYICNDLDDYLASEDKVNHMSWHWWTHGTSKEFKDASHNTWLFPDDKSEEARISLLAGDYYIFFSSTLSSGNDKALNYKFALKDFKALKAGKNEGRLFDTRLHGSNGEVDYTNKYYAKEEMPVIETNKFYNGILTEDSTGDFYHFTLEKDGPLFLTLESDDGIGKCFFTLNYWSKTPGYEGRHEIILQGDKYSSTSDVPMNSKQLENSYYEDDRFIAKLQTKFPAGEYVLGINSQVYHDDSKDIYLGESGQYRFMISTGKVSEKPVTSLKLSQTVIPMAKNDTATFTATVGPKDAPDTSVRFEVDKAGIIEITQKTPAEGEAPVNGETEYEIKALANGQANVKIITNGLDKNKKPIEQTCAVSVIETVLAEPIAVKEKIDLRGAEYFNSTEIAKGDKFDVIAENPKDKVGSVSNGVFTAKKAGKVTIVWNKQVDKKTYVPQKQITIELKMPSYKKNDKGKDKKASDLIAKRGTVIEPSDWLLDLDKVETIKPDFFECVDKKGVVTLDEDFAANGKLTVEKTGSVKVTAYYGTDKKTAAKMVYTIKSKMPGIKDAKVKSNPVKDKAKDKVVTVSVTNVPKTVKLTAENWKIVKATEDSSGVTLTTEAPDSEKIKFTPLEKGNYTKASISIAPGTEAQVLAVVVTIDGVDYQGIVRIQ